MDEVSNTVAKIKKTNFRKIIYELNNEPKALMRVFKYIRL